jgi:hypothetical protein
MIMGSSVAPPSWHARRQSLSQTAGSISPEYLTRVVGYRKRGGKGAVRISRLNTRVPGGSGDTPLSCSGLKQPPRRGVYFLPLMTLRASPSSTRPRVSCRRSFAGVLLMQSCTEGALMSLAAAALPFPPGGVCTEASWPWCAVPPAFKTTERMRDAELSAYCTAACSMSTFASLRRLCPSVVEGSGMA